MSGYDIIVAKGNLETANGGNYENNEHSCGCGIIGFCG